MGWICGGSCYHHSSGPNEETGGTGVGAADDDDAECDGDADDGDGDADDDDGDADDDGDTDDDDGDADEGGFEGICKLDRDQTAIGSSAKSAVSTLHPSPDYLDDEEDSFLIFSSK